MATKYGQILGLGALGELTRVSKYAEKKKVPLKGLKKGLIHWSGEEHGGHLTKVAAQDLSHYLQVSYLSQQYADLVPPLGTFWPEKKEKHGFHLGSPRDIGVATGQLVQAIQPIDDGSGKWRVGISENTRVSEKIGSYDRVIDYALLLEYGSAKYGIPAPKQNAVSKPGEHFQPPRPLFLYGFLGWLEERAPELIKETIWADLKKNLNELMSKRAKPEDMIQSYQED